MAPLECFQMLPMFGFLVNVQWIHEKINFLVAYALGQQELPWTELFLLLKWTWPKKYVSQNFDKRQVVHNLNQHVQKVNNTQPFENFYI